MTLILGISSYWQAMETSTTVGQSTPSYQLQSARTAANIICFNVGGKRYKVSCSLFKGHPNSMLAQCAFDQWQSDPDEEVFFERDGYRFRFIIDYLQHNGHVLLCMTVPKAAFLAELAYYGIKGVDLSKITYQFGTNVQCLAHALHEIRSKITAVTTAEIMAWDIHCAAITLAKECVSHYLTSGSELKIDIHGPDISQPDQDGTVMCSHDTWVALLLLLCDGGTYYPQAHEECNQYLSEIGLEIISVVKPPDKCIIQIAMKLTDM